MCLESFRHDPYTFFSDSVKHNQVWDKDGSLNFFMNPLTLKMAGPLKVLKRMEENMDISVKMSLSVKLKPNNIIQEKGLHVARILVSLSH